MLEETREEFSIINSWDFQICKVGSSRSCLIHPTEIWDKTDLERSQTRARRIFLMKKTITYKSRWLQQFYLSGRAHNSGSRGRGFESCWLSAIILFFSVSLQCVLNRDPRFVTDEVSCKLTCLDKTLDPCLFLKQVSLIQTVIIYGPVNFIRLTPSERKLTKNSWLDVSLDFRLEEDLAETQSRRAPWPFWFKLGFFFYFTLF